ncbi:HDOD domain-containing protein [Desulfosarcina ovata]|uniref:HDOD domain-containing protein n=1 Tax=Desulfosarcina ovata subsp. ovata TaxID=2752305 RepID=A0A5K8AKH0_9BACT|nr:HDOD domain-containing protein [Desulfosarcina ovata]BBO93213.1 hypothetical protein DSCOOX_63930 [Desulfosarcina ovata subsp. ovata]
MKSETALDNLIEEMRSKGNLPALNDTVLEISRLAKNSESSAPDLAAVIMRDCGLASNLLAAVNSSYYAPRFPIKTISSAVTYIGFEKVYLLSLGLGLFRHTMETLQARNLLKLYATSYFSGTLAMSLAEVYGHASPEEIFIAGLLYRLPGLSLANTFPQHFLDMQSRINERGMTLNQACLDVFQVRYDDICDAVLAIYHLPEDVERVINQGKVSDEPLTMLVGEAAGLAAMLFGDRPAGKDVLRKTEKRIRKLLDRPKFSVSETIRQTFENDRNIKHFFSLGAEDVEIMVNLLEWGKANPMAVVTHLDFGTTLDAESPADTPEALIGHFLTELALCRKRGGELNPLLMLSQEALFRCLPGSEIFMAFLSQDKQQLLGRFYVGSSLHLNAQEFSVAMTNTDAAIVRCMKVQSPTEWQKGGVGLGLPYALFGRMPFQAAYMVPIVVNKQAIGLCFTGRLNGKGFNDRECVWIDQIVSHIQAAFSVTRT